MRLPDGSWLTYCLNIHPTQSWAETRDAIGAKAAAVKASVAPDAPFAIGLRVSAETLAELAAPGPREELRDLLAEHDFQAVTMNGFPYGPFHGVAVKEAVYAPDWRSEERVAYTCGLADLMAEIAPAGEPISLSTVPGAFKPLGLGAEAAMADAMLRAASHCARLAERAGAHVALALEPEPYCFLETIEESVAFFEAYLYAPAAVTRFAELSGLAGERAEEALRAHLGLCYDVCHAAVEFEDPKASLAALRAAGLPVHKLQLSAALRAPQVTPEVRAALTPYAEPTYLHQVVSRAPGGALRREADLPEALARGAAADGEEWRVHFHVPLFVEDLGAFGTTQAFLSEILALHRRAPISPHLEIETYTWDVLPEALRATSVEEAVSRELRWVLERVAS